MLDYEPQTYSELNAWAKAEKKTKAKKEVETKLEKEEAEALIARSNDLLSELNRLQDRINCGALDGHRSTRLLIITNELDYIKERLAFLGYPNSVSKQMSDKIFIRTEPDYRNQNVLVSKKLNVMQALRKLVNEKNLLTTRAFIDSPPLTLSELRSKTGFKTNDLNHSLTALREADIVFKLENKYTLTTYGRILIRAIDDIYNEVKRRKSDIYSPYLRIEK